MNKISITGRLTNDVELKTSQNGTSYVRFRVASQAKTKNADGSKKTDFFGCNAYNKSAEVIAQYCHKGDQISVCGTMVSEIKDNVTYWNVNVEDFEFITVSKDSVKNDKQTQQKEFIPESDTKDLPF